MALRLGHRESVDFDFFSTERFDTQDLHSAIPYLRGARVTQREENTLTCAVGRVSVKVSFFGGVNIRAVHKPDLADNGLRIASLLDVAATKATAVQGRAARKDYDDMAAIIEAGMSLGEILGAAAAVFGTASFNPLIDHPEGACASRRQRAEGPGGAWAFAKRPRNTDSRRPGHPFIQNSHTRNSTEHLRGRRK